jgi:hypothetical protein
MAENWPELRLHQVRHDIRRFGLVPDPRELLPADILLIAGSSPVSRLIGRAQTRAGFAAHDAMWSHVALFTGDNMVVEANPWGGVALRPMVEATFGRRILARRRPGLAMEDRYRVVIKALAHLRRRYSILTVPSLAWRAWAGPRARPSGHVGGITICSTLVADAYVEAVQADIRPPSMGAAWPADVSHTDRLSDVTIGWVRVRQ